MWSARPVSQGAVDKGHWAMDDEALCEQVDEVAGLPCASYDVRLPDRWLGEASEFFWSDAVAQAPIYPIDASLVPWLYASCT